MNNNEIRELSSEADWQNAFPILKALRNDLIEGKFLLDRELLLAKGYTLLGLFAEGELVAVAGIDIYPHITRGLDCWVHDLATKERCRSRGYAKLLMQHIEKLVKSKGCTRLCVHTRQERLAAQNFYENKLNYKKAAIVYYQEL